MLDSSLLRQHSTYSATKGEYIPGVEPLVAFSRLLIGLSKFTSRKSKPHREVKDQLKEAIMLLLDTQSVSEQTRMDSEDK